MIAAILAKKIVSLFIIMGMGYVLVKLKILKSTDSKILSLIMLNLLIPCAIIMAFQVEYTDEIKEGLIFAFIIAIIIHVALIMISELLGRVFHFDGVERNSIIISNAANLIIPIVISRLGNEWVVYATGFMCVQLIVLWTYGKMTLCGETKPEIKKIVTNVNLIAVVVGLLLFITQIHIPEIIKDSINSVSLLVGPVGMLITGMLISGMNLKRIFTYKRIWIVTACRLVIIPLLAVGLMKYTGVAGWAANGTTILLISLLATSTPSAASITAMSQIYGQDAEYASALNVITTVLCIATMPLVVMLYQM